MAIAQFSKEMVVVFNGNEERFIKAINSLMRWSYDRMSGTNEWTKLICQLKKLPMGL